jgi:branched-subunit amino acid ABC-type transport system permease component
MLTFVVTGLITGSIYALLAVGLVFMYQTTGVVNFAFGAFGALAAFTFSTLRFENGPVISLIAVVLGGGALGALIGAATTRAQTTSTTVKAVASLALTQAIIGLIPLVWGSTGRPVATLSTGVAFTLFDVVISWQQVITFLVAIAVAAAVLAFFRFGSLGSALRAMAANTNVARLIGLPVRRLWIMSWAIGTGIAALAGVLIAPNYGLAPATLSFTVLYPLAAAVAASFRRPLVAAGVAVLLGLGDNLMRSQTAPFDVDFIGVPLSTYAPMLPFVAVVVALVAAKSGRFSTWERV